MYLQLNLLYSLAFYYVYLLAKAVHEIVDMLATVYGFHQIIIIVSPKGALYMFMQTGCQVDM